MKCVICEVGDVPELAHSLSIGIHNMYTSMLNMGMSNGMHYVLGEYMRVYLQMANICIPSLIISGMYLYIIYIFFFVNNTY